MRALVFVIIALASLVVALTSGLLRYWRTRSFPEAVERGAAAAGATLALGAAYLAVLWVK
ncbi:hypothetical protein [Kitasatospora sp. NPDC056273]|uniref:hypothetical protein n=1 Tax=Kitasatospora sp. NPDC056273 TaxID=3345769 RepID=UPI0035D96987